MCGTSLVLCTEQIGKEAEVRVVIQISKQTKCLALQMEDTFESSVGRLSTVFE